MKRFLLPPPQSCKNSQASFSTYRWTELPGSWQRIVRLRGAQAGLATELPSPECKLAFKGGFGSGNGVSAKAAYGKRSAWLYARTLLDSAAASLAKGIELIASAHYTKTCQDGIVRVL